MKKLQLELDSSRWGHTPSLNQPNLQVLTQLEKNKFQLFDTMKLSTLDPLAIGGLSVVVKVGRGGVESLTLAKPTYTRLSFEVFSLGKSLY